MASEPAIAKLLELITRLDSATRRGLIEWEATDRQFAFAYSSKASSVLVASVDDDGAVPFELQVLNEKGNVIDSMRSHTSSDSYDGDQVFTFNSGGKELAALYENVRRAVTGVDKKIDEILSELPEVDPWE
ncbi:hypothetical protein [Mycolicibacterium sp. D5.8-2]|uniref:hypothetical protein n=1 Tax=Mycolicibacterium sp. D5.8-2 TaxID=3085903 RepID=UPI00298CB985|nr:hypothetical protein [Mycolicibacterium sp. D5.8-2]MDW5610661.1 hypothetical protein [Mycolicibacterium sp. D5.8-2]